MPFFIPPMLAAMYGPAAIAGIGAAAKGLQRYGPQIRTGLQSATNLANRGLTGLQNVAQPYSDKLASSWASNPMATSLASLFGMSEVADPKESNVAMLLQGLTKSAKYLKANDEGKEQMMKNLLESLGIDIEVALEQAGQELLEKEEPSIPEEKKKGGYVKKQRKRKHYRASSFVKMKKKKKYKKKYIKT